MGTYVVTGAASGIGAATTALLRERGHRVLTVDLHDADVEVDLGTPAGRAAAVAGVRSLLGGNGSGALEGVVANAGIAGGPGVAPEAVVSVDYFGSVALVEGLHDELAAARRSAVVVVSSDSITTMPAWPADVASACLRGDETGAREAAGRTDAMSVYPAAKAALAYWTRRTAVSADWAGVGIRLNALAPGLITTPMTERLREDPEVARMLDEYPTALGRPGRPEEVAAVIAFLLSEESSLVLGAVVFADGGTDAIVRPVAPHGADVGPVV